MEPSLRSRIAAARVGRRSWWASFALFSLLGLLWATALPLFGSPDEPAHVTRAVSVARGEWIGKQIPGLTGGWRRVDVPQVVVSGNDVGCFAFKNAVTAACLLAEAVQVRQRGGEKKRPARQPGVAGTPLRGGVVTHGPNELPNG